MNLGRSPLDLQLLPGEHNCIMSALCLISVTLKLLVNLPLLAAPILGSLEEMFDVFLGAAIFRLILCGKSCVRVQVVWVFNQLNLSSWSISSKK